MQAWLESKWYGSQNKGWKILCFPFHCILQCLVLSRYFLYRFGLLSSWRSPVPVVIVGNISVGGTGKTPLVIWLVEKLKAAGYFPGVISRGYGGMIQHPSEVPEGGNPSLFGDEPLLIAKRASCPVWVGKDRPAAAKALLRAYPQCNVIISDDGMQHYALQRDIEIVVVDGSRLYGNKLLLPLGPMREPMSRLTRVDAIVVNGGSSCKPGEYLMRLDGDEFSSLHTPQKIVQASHFLNKKNHAVAGIGNPKRFFNHLRKLGVKVTEHSFPDHHPFQPSDLSIPDADAILITEKDAVKCQHFPQKNIWVLPVKAEVMNGLENKVINKIESFYGRKTA